MKRTIIFCFITLLVWSCQPKTKNVTNEVLELLCLEFEIEEILIITNSEPFENELAVLNAYPEVAKDPRLKELFIKLRDESRNTQNEDLEHLRSEVIKVSISDNWDKTKTGVYISPMVFSDKDVTAFQFFDLIIPSTKSKIALIAQYEIDQDDELMIVGYSFPLLKINGKQSNQDELEQFKRRGIQRW